MSLAVVGIDYPNKKGPARRFELAMLKPGDLMELRLEPDNPADPRAVAVYSERGIRVGYLTAERCGRVGSLMRRGVEVRVIFQSLGTHRAMIRAAFDGEVPVLPTIPNARQASVSEDQNDFTPDWEE